MGKLSNKEKNEFNKKLIEQKNLGYPNFKENIAEVLVNEFGFQQDNAMRLAFHPLINEFIIRDIIWAQHMGSEYWAEVINYRKLDLD
jgi:hypothetical protein